MMVNVLSVTLSAISLSMSGWVLYRVAGTDPAGLAIATAGGVIAWLVGLWPLYRRLHP
jgi:hypothetical protein